MILFLRALFLAILVSMLWVTSWASLRCPLFAVPPHVVAHPWFIATLCDAYWGFMTFFVWVCFKQTSWIARAAWFIAIMLLGNIAMSAYCLDELWRTPRTGSVADVLTTRRAGAGGLGLAVAGLGIIVVLLALLRG
jgi:predicted permease